MVAIPKPKRLLLSSLAMHVESVRVREDLLVAVPRLGRGNDALARLDQLPAQRDVFLRDAPCGHGRCGVVAAELFDEGWCEAGVGFELCELLGVVEEGDDALEGILWSVGDIG